MCGAYVISLLVLLTTRTWGQIIVDRSENNLTAVPSNITISVEILLLTHNFIARISATDLSTFVNVTKVNLVSNKIRVLEDGCFDNNGKLAELRLDRNKIHHWPISLGPLESSLKVLGLHSSIMRDIANFDLRSQSLMHDISLGGNNFDEMGIDIITLLPRYVYSLFLDDCAFSRLPNFTTYIPGIKHIGMEKNNIRHISVDDFKDLTELKTLELERNKLQTIPDLYDMKSLKNLKLAGNPLVCNHTFCWIIMWNHEKKSKLKIGKAACHSPDDLDGVKISNVDPVDIACYEGRYVL